MNHLNTNSRKNADGLFLNTEDAHCTQSWWKVLKWKINFQNRAKWPKQINIIQEKIKQQTVPQNQINATFINHATVLVQMDNVNILTDPVWSTRTSPVSWAGPKRVQKPGVKLEDIPKIDLILVSHNHYDHMDLKTLECFAARDSCKIVTGLNNKHYLKAKSQTHSHELDWNESLNINGLKVTFLPARHWSKRSLFDTNKSLWGAFAVEGSKRFYFAGDSGYGKHFKQAGDMFKSFDLCLLPIGAYSPRWCLKAHHMDPAEAVQAHLDLNSKQSLAIHHSTFQLTDEPIFEPIELLEESKQKAELKTPFTVLKNGESLHILNNL